MAGLRECGPVRDRHLPVVAGGRIEGIVSMRDLAGAEDTSARLACQAEMLRVFISQLRRKIEPDLERSTIIATDPEVGCRWLLRTTSRRPAA
jgi:hypothetical protein